MAWLSELDRPDLSGMSPPTTGPLLDCKCEGESCFLCISYSSIMAYIHILTTCKSQKIATVLAKHVPPWRKTQDKVLFKSRLYQSTVFHRPSKKTKEQGCIEHTYVSQDLLLCRNKTLIILKAPSHTKKMDTWYKD